MPEITQVPCHWRRRRACWRAFLKSSCPTVPRGRVEVVPNTPCGAFHPCRAALYCFRWPGCPLSARPARPRCQAGDRSRAQPDATFEPLRAALQTYVDQTQPFRKVAAQEAEKVPGKAAADAGAEQSVRARQDSLADALRTKLAAQRQAGRSRDAGDGGRDHRRNSERPLTPRGARCCWTTPAEQNGSPANAPTPTINQQACGAARAAAPERSAAAAPRSSSSMTSSPAPSSSATSTPTWWSTSCPTRCRNWRRRRRRPRRPHRCPPARRRRCRCRRSGAARCSR